MSPSSPDHVVLTDQQRHDLQRLARAGRTQQRLALRARIVLHAADGHNNTGTAADLGVCADTARKWRHRWCRNPTVASLADATRSGRPPRFTPVQVARVKALACTHPADHALPLSRWSCPDLARQAVAVGICPGISSSTVRLWLAQDPIKPWQFQSWIFITDPDFETKAERILDLYAGRWDGQPLGRNDYVISSDEKTSIQARCRCHETLPPGRSRIMRVNHDYHRRGAVAYLAAYDVHRGRVHGRCEDTTGIDPFMRLVQQVMSQEPYKSAERVFWVVDNGSSHRGQAAIDRLTTTFPNTVMVHTPIHASWLNQVEIYFSIIQRKVLSPNDFTDTDVVAQRLADFEERYNQTARPFRWNFTTNDLTDLLRKLDRTENPADPARPVTRQPQAA